MKTIITSAIFMAILFTVSAVFGLFWPTLFTVVLLIAVVYFAVNATPSPYPHEGKK